MNAKPRSLILGIDPGVTGALALFDPSNDSLVETYSMPVTDSLRRRRYANTTNYRVCEIGVAELLEKIAPVVSVAVIELVGARPLQGVTSVFSFGLGTGILHGALSAFKLPMLTAKPEIWKVQLGLSSNKENSNIMATKLFPAFKDRWPNKSNSGHSEAALLAYFGKRMLALMRAPKPPPSEFAKALLG